MPLWLEQHPLLVLGAIALIACLESFALVGLLVPGVVLLFSLATLAQDSGIPLPAALMAAAAGACAGDLSSFFIGRSLQHRLDRLAWFQRHQHWLAEGEWFFRRWGWLSVLIGRFLGPLRPVMPLVAGTLNMPARLFVGLTLVSVLIWAPVYILPGYLTGEVVDLVQQRSLAERSLVITAVLALAGLLIVLTVYHHLHPEHPTTPRWLPLMRHVPARAPFSSLMLALASGATLIWLILARPLPWDTLLSAQVPLWRATAADPFFVGFTLLGAPDILLLTGTLVTFWFLLRGHRWLTAHLVLAMALAHWGLFELKALFDVPRPDWVANQPPGEAFPSGHAAGFALYLALLSGFANAARPAQRRWQLYLPASLLILTMAFSRVWLGVHWLSDVAAGVALALLFTALARISLAALSDRPIRLTGGGAVALLVLLTFLAYLIIAWPEARLAYGLAATSQ